ncbi:MAG TPA: glycosyltransferase, partial [Solirubrobacteraceae bacterium]|nr:glycosyltransferase [Solirubrobacteraceae bacterium]
ALRSGDPNLAQAMDMAVRTLYGACDLVLSPSPASDEVLRGLGIAPARIARWDRGVDCERFDPSLRGERALKGELNVLYSGRITKEKGAELLADAFLEAHRRDPRLHLVLAGGGPEKERLRERLDEHATFLGWQEGVELAKVYASADIFLFPSATDTFGQVILEAQASGLPVVAVGVGGPTSLIEHRVSGLLCEPTYDALAESVLELAGSPLMRRRLAAVALTGVRQRTWDAALERLGDGYRRVLAAPRRAEAGTDPAGAPRDIDERSGAPRRAASSPGVRRAA